MSLDSPYADYFAVISVDVDCATDWAPWAFQRLSSHLLKGRKAKWESASEMNLVSPLRVRVLRTRFHSSTLGTFLSSTGAGAFG